MKSFLLGIILLSAIKNHSTENTELYQRIGLNFDCSDEEIEEKYKEFQSNNRMTYRIKQAFDILRNRTKKLIYDTDGMNEIYQYEEYARHNAINRRYRRAKSIFVTLWAKPSESITGVQKKITFKRETVCRHCRGTGADGGKLKRCDKCHGRGTVNRRVQTGMGMIMTMQTHCPACGGQGTMAAHKCSRCGGSEAVVESKSLVINIPKGTKHMQKLIYVGEGHASRTSIPGDVIVTVKYRDSPEWKRVQNDLVHSLNVSFKEALFGFSKTINLIDGSSKTVTKNGVSDFDEEIVYENEGAFAPMDDDEIYVEFNDAKKLNEWNLNESLPRGKLIFKIQFSLPKKLTNKQMQILKTIYK
jgi:DnaJ-class molecular chaperone